MFGRHQKSFFRENMFINHILNHRSYRFVVLNLVIGAVMISFSGVWVKLSHVTPTVSAFYRVFFGGILLLAAAAHRHELKWHGGRHLLLGLACGFIFALDLGLYHYSIHFVGPGLGTILPNFQVLILALVGSLFFKETFRLTFVCAIPLAFCGLFMIVGIDWGGLGRLYKIGVYCGLAAAFCYAGFLLSLRKLQADHSGISFFYVLMLVSLITAVFLAVEIHYTGDTFKLPGWRSFLALAALGFFSQVLGWILIANVLPQIRASLSGLILLLQPALAFVWDVLFFKRPTDIVNWMGVVVALAAIYLGTVGAPAPEECE